MPKLTMSFTGTCLFVDDYNRVVLADCSTARPSKNNPNVIIPAHFPYLRVRTDELEASDAFAQSFSMSYREPVKPQPPIDTVVYILAQMEIGIAVDLKNTHKKDDTDHKKKKAPKNATEAKSVHWHANLSKIAPGHDIVDSRYLVDNPPPAVGAFVKTAPAAVTSRRVPDDIFFSFAPQVDKDYQRSLALGVDAVFTSSNNVQKFEIVLRSYDPDQPGETRLKFKAQDVHVTVGNSPLEAILQIAHVHECQTGTPNYDFELFYELVTKKPTATWPVPVCNRLVAKPKDLGSENCPPASGQP